MAKIVNSTAAVRVLSVDEVGSVSGGVAGTPVIWDLKAKLTEAYKASHPYTFGSDLKDDIAALGR